MQLLTQDEKAFVPSIESTYDKMTQQMYLSPTVYPSGSRFVWVFHGCLQHSKFPNFTILRMISLINVIVLPICDILR